jgi:hypothetical protein
VEIRKVSQLLVGGGKEVRIKIPGSKRNIYSPANLIADVAVKCVRHVTRWFLASQSSLPPTYRDDDDGACRKCESKP